MILARKSTRPRSRGWASAGRLIASVRVGAESDCHEGVSGSIGVPAGRRGARLTSAVGWSKAAWLRPTRTVCGGWRHTLGPDAYGCVEMMSGAVWVREQLQACGWRFAVADARKVKAIAPLACKTDKVDARVLAQLAARDLVPELWVPSLADRELRERLRRRGHWCVCGPRRVIGCSGC